MLPTSDPHTNQNCSSSSSAYDRMWLFVLLIITGCTHAHERHPHRGVVKPFASGDPGVKLSSTALHILRKGKPYKTQIQDGSAGRGLVVQDVNAPVDVVWEHILAFARYPKMVPKTVECKVYKQESLRNGKKRIFVRMKVGFPFFKLQFYINHLHDPNNNSLTWTLDYDRKSDLDDSAGYWYCIPHPERPQESTRVYYSVEVSIYPWVPQFVVDFMSKQALTDATGWVKKFSEAAAMSTTKHVPRQLHINTKAHHQVDPSTTPSNRKIQKFIRRVIRCICNLFSRRKNRNKNAQLAELHQQATTVYDTSLFPTKKTIDEMYNMTIIAWVCSFTLYNIFFVNYAV